MESNYIPSIADAKNELWRRGLISGFKLDEAQKDFHTRVKESKEKITVILSSRRIGKTVWALVLAVETCLKKENSVVKFLAPTRFMITDIIEKVMPIVLEGCPQQFRPQYNKNKYVYKFQNGSRLEMAGTDAGNADKLRGGFAHLCIVDEAQSCSDLLNVVRSVLIPTTTNTKGKIVILGTAPEDTEHDFLKFIEEADLKGTLIKKTIYENPRIRPDEIEDIIAAYPGGENNPDFRREYKCEIIKNPQYSAIPEFDTTLEKDIVKEWKRPPFYDYYESMDLGGKDLTVVLFGYFDFKNAVLVIEDELVMDFQLSGNNIKSLTERIQQKEQQNFSDPIVHEVKQPFLRVSDIDYIVLKEIREHSLGQVNFVITRKDDKKAAINNLRIMLNNRRIIINPKCQTLLKHLRNVKWSKSNRDVFDRSVDNGHYDAVDALIYMTRSIVYSKNPYPRDYGMNANDLVMLGKAPSGVDNSTVDVFKSIFKIGKKYGK